MLTYTQAKEHLIQNPKTWLITGVAGFIGSNIAEQLLRLNQKVIGLDNLYSGSKDNLDEIKNNCSENQWLNFDFHNLDINNKSDCNKIFNSKVNYILHHAAIGSVPFSIKHPEICAKTNIDGFKNIIELSLEHNIDKFIYASSSSVYGDNKDEIKLETNIGKPLSPYAENKYQNECVAKDFSERYNLKTTGFRYFNVYGKRQNPNSQYSAVIPKWITAMIQKKPIFINGDGSTTRDFCYINDITQANILACVNHDNSTNQENHHIYNIGTGKSIALNNLFETIKKILNLNNIVYDLSPEYREFLPGDIVHSCPDIIHAKEQINFQPCYNLEQGLADILTWYNHHTTT